MGLLREQFARNLPIACESPGLIRVMSQSSRLVVLKGGWLGVCGESGVSVI